MTNEKRHASITDEYVARLESGFKTWAQRVKAAATWDETQRLMYTGTYPYLLALRRVNEGWTREQIDQELSTE